MTEATSAAAEDAVRSALLAIHDGSRPLLDPVGLTVRHAGPPDDQDEAAVVRLDARLARAATIPAPVYYLTPVAVLAAAFVAAVAVGAHVSIAVITGLTAMLLTLAGGYVAVGPRNRRFRDEEVARIRSQHDGRRRLVLWRPGHAAPSTEAALVAVALDVRRDIEASPAWHSSDLDTHRARLDLGEEIQQIALRAEQLGHVRQRLDIPAESPETADTPQIAQARSALAGYQRSITRVEDALVRRVAALWRYRTHLRQLDEQLALLGALDRAQTDDELLQELVLSTAQDEVSTENLGDLVAELASTRELIATTLEVLRADADHVVAIRAGTVSTGGVGESGGARDSDRP